jgi:hypothetical protein
VPVNENNKVLTRLLALADNLKGKLSTFMASMPGDTIAKIRDASHRIAWIRLDERKIKPP